MPDRIIRRLNGPRGSALLAGAVIAAVHAVAYVDVDRGLTLPSGLDALDRAVPLWVYAGLWATAMVVSTVGAFRNRARRQRDWADAWGHGLLSGLLTCWGLTYLLGWVIDLTHGQPSRQWVFGVIYLAVAVLVSTSARMTNPGSAARRGQR